MFRKIWHDIPCMMFNKIPAAAMIIPMFLSIIFNTLFPDFVNMGSLTTALFGKKSGCLPDRGRPVHGGHGAQAQ